MTNENKLAYIMYYANYMLNTRTMEHTKHFVKGLKSVFSGYELSIFYPNEIQLLISGGVSEIDIDDLRANSKLNRFKPEQRPDEAAYLEEFWKFLKSLSNEQKEKFLSFCTGGNRPPLLGFKYLHPEFCLSKLDVEDQASNRFPSASTCANMLHLPFYGNS